MKITLGTVTQEQDIAAETAFLNVPWQITDDQGSLLIEGVQGFSLGASEDDIKAFASKVLADFKEKKANEETSRAAQVALDNAAATAAAVSGLEVTE